MQSTREARGRIKESEQELTVPLAEVEQFAFLTEELHEAKELWSGKRLQVTDGVLCDAVAVHGAGLYRLTP